VGGSGGCVRCMGRLRLTPRSQRGHVRAGAGTGLRKVVSEWISDGQSRIDVVAKYGEIENWDTAELTNLAYLFESKSTFNADISKWIVSKVTNMIGSKSILPNCWYLLCPLLFFLHVSISAHLNPSSSFPSNTTAFYGASSFNADISKWSVSSVTNLESSKSFLPNCWYLLCPLLFFFYIHFTHLTLFFPKTYNSLSWRFRFQRRYQQLDSFKSDEHVFQ
jgi:surface protein